MRYFWFFVLIVAFAASTYKLTAWLESENTKPISVAQTSDAKSFSIAKEFTASRMSFELHQANQQPVVLHFWATWCGPCIQELPELIKVSSTLKKLGIQFVAVAEDEDWQVINDFFKQYPNLEKLKSESILILDQDRKIATLYGSNQFPETFLINHQFKIESLFIGAQSWSHPEMLALLNKLAIKK